MVETKTLEDGVAASAMIALADLPALAKHFTTLVNTRPDGEEPGQPASSEIANAARTLGLRYFHIPVVPGQITDDQVALFGSTVDEAPGPVLSFCRTGTRAASLWALVRAARLGPEKVIEAARKAGFDLSSLAPRIRARTPA